MYYHHLPFPDDYPRWSRPDARAESPDLTLALAVIDRLRAVRRLRQQLISVQVQNRVVILEGAVATVELRQLAATHAWRTDGVFDVCNRLVAPTR
jgi:osmotically-inducible protein OsmY